jgi:hypothetical protein
MSYLETNPLQHSTIQSIYADWESIVTDPPYQRNGDIWSLEKKQLLIDSIINRYDIPKLYFHRFEREEARARGKNYAIIDGRQRLETIVQFIEGTFSLSDEFVYLEDDTVKASGMNYSELATKYPKIKSRFDAFSLPIVTVQTDDLELVEDMFSRLNEAVPLNAAEKRRAIGGEMVRAIDDVSKHPFFTKKVKFSNKRYQHKEVAVRLLFIAHQLKHNAVVDTKKPFLDAFARDFKSGKTRQVQAIKDDVSTTLRQLVKVFNDSDSLLAQQASIPIYVFVFKSLQEVGKESRFSRTRLRKFNEEREKNRRHAEQNIATATFELLEYDRLSQQGTNDASSLRERWRILQNWIVSN